MNELLPHTTWVILILHRWKKLDVAEGILYNPVYAKSTEMSESNLW